MMNDVTAARWVKLKNRRIHVLQLANGDFGLLFRILGEGRREIRETRIAISKEGATALLHCLAHFDELVEPADMTVCWWQAAIREAIGRGNV